MRTGLVKVFQLISEVVKKIASNFFNLVMGQKGGRIGFAITSKGFNTLLQSRKFFECHVSIMTCFRSVACFSSF